MGQLEVEEDRLYYMVRLCKGIQKTILPLLVVAVTLHPTLKAEYHLHEVRFLPHV